jgi:hypothetical protein
MHKSEKDIFTVLTGIALLIMASGLIVAWGEGSETEVAARQAWRTRFSVAKNAVRAKTEVVDSIYVPVYSHIYSEDNTRTALLTGTLSVRNTDPEKSITLKSVAYYDTKGKLLSQLCPEPLRIGPMATVELVVPRSGAKGPCGANFFVQWSGAAKVSEPIAEAVMISTGSTPNISFVSRGALIKRS